MQREIFQKIRRAGLWALAPAVLAAGCGGPYVHVKDEFNRARANFSRAPQNIEGVTICYSSFDTSAGAVTEMAEARCAEFGKTAVFESETMTVCPALTPNAAKFICVKKDAAADESILSHL